MKRESDCPLCGAKMTAGELLDACANLLAPELGVISARCPHCQGYLEVMPSGERLEIGYLTSGAQPGFARVTSLPCPGLEIERSENPPTLKIGVAGRSWTFTE